MEEAEAKRILANAGYKDLSDWKIFWERAQVLLKADRVNTRIYPTIRLEILRKKYREGV